MFFTDLPECECCGRKSKELKKCGDLRIFQIISNVYKEGQDKHYIICITDLHLPQGCGKLFCAKCHAPSISIKLSHKFSNADQVMTKLIQMVPVLYSEEYCRDCAHDNKLIPGEQIARKTHPFDIAIIPLVQEARPGSSIMIAWGKLTTKIEYNEFLDTYLEKILPNSERQ